MTMPLLGQGWCSWTANQRPWDCVSMVCLRPAKTAAALNVYSAQNQTRFCPALWQRGPDISLCRGIMAFRRSVSIDHFIYIYTSCRTCFNFIFLRVLEQNLTSYFHAQYGMWEVLYKMRINHIRNGKPVEREWGLLVLQWDLDLAWMFLEGKICWEPPALPSMASSVHTSAKAVHKNVQQNQNSYLSVKIPMMGPYF